MCCFKERKTPATILTVLSAIMMVMGAVLVFLCVLFQNNDNIFNHDVGVMNDSMHEFRQKTIAAIMAAAIGTLLLGACGSCCLLPACNNFCLVLCYGLSVFCMWVTFVASGGALIGVALVGPEDA